jgi:hypothetical protein
MWTAVILGVAMTTMGCGERGGVRATSQADAPPPQPAAQPTSAPVASAAPACPAPPVTAVAPRPPEPRKAELGGDARLAVRRLVLTEGVKNREPVDAATRFKSDAKRIYAFVEVENKDRAPGEIVVEFEPPGGGAPHGDVTLPVGASPRWRTWAYTRTAHVAGSWTAVVKNRKGEVLARAPFEVTL